MIGDHAPRVPFVLVFFPLKGRLSKGNKTTVARKRAMTEKRDRWQSKEWYGRAKSRRQQPAGEDGGESSHDTWKNSQPQGKWREISAEMDAVGNHFERKTNTWNRSCKESVKRDTELFKIVEFAVMDQQREQKERGMIRELLEQLQKRREEEDEARGLIEMQRNLDEAQNKSCEVERKLDRVLWEYIEAFDKQQGRPQLKMTKLWQMMQSRDAKNLNLDKRP